MKKIANKITARVELYSEVDSVPYSCTVVVYALTTEDGLQRVADWVNYQAEDEYDLEVNTCTVWDDVAFVNYYADEDNNCWQADIHLLSRENVEVEERKIAGIWNYGVEAIDTENWL